MKKSFILCVFIFIFLIFSLTHEKDLVGPLSQEEILENFPDWEEEAASYSPRPEMIDRLKAIDHEIKIEIILGTWCLDSKQHVSAYFKIMEMADNPLLVSSYLGIPKEKEDRQRYVQGKNIVRVPTFIISINEEEIGRIIEHPKKSVEEGLIEILEP